MLTRSGRRAMALKHLAAAILAKDGLKLLPGWKVRILSNNELTAHDPADARGSLHGRIRAGIRIPNADQKSNEELADILAKEAVRSIRRTMTCPELLKAEKEDRQASGWAVLSSPLLISLCVKSGVTDGKTIPSNILFGDVRRLGLKNDIRLMRVIENDILGGTVDLQMSDTTPSANFSISPRSFATVRVEMPVPIAIIGAMAGKYLCDVIDIADCGISRIDTAVRKIKIRSAEWKPKDVDKNGIPKREHLRIELEPVTWMPWSEQDEDLARITSLSPEIF